jgi:acetyltransferase-like isoleucine patch superfamily enzyme
MTTMTLSTGARMRRWVKARDGWLANAIYRFATGLRTASMPAIPGVHLALYVLHRGVAGGWASLTRILWYTPLLQSRLERPASRLYCYSGMPLVLGPVSLRFGRSVRISGQTTISGRTASITRPRLTVGDNVDIGWQTTIAVGRRVDIGNNVRIAGRAFLAGYPGHPLDAAARAAGAPDSEDQVGDIVLEDDVWLATGVTVSAGVRIGRGTVVAAGSVVTRDLPPFVLAAGVPARVVRHLSAPPRGPRGEGGGASLICRGLSRGNNETRAPL